MCLTSGEGLNGRAERGQGSKIKRTRSRFRNGKRQEEEFESLKEEVFEIFFMWGWTNMNI